MVAKPQGQNSSDLADISYDVSPDFAREKLLAAESDLSAIEQEAESTKNRTKSHKNASKKGGDQSDSATTRLRQSEENQRSSLTKSSSQYRNSVSGKESTRTRRFRTSGSGKSSGKLRKLAPASIITVLLAVGATIFYFIQTMLPGQLSALYTKATDIQYSSYTARNQRIFQYMMDGDSAGSSNDLTKKYSSVSSYTKRRLKNNGIEVGYLDSDGSFKTSQTTSSNKLVLKYGNEYIGVDDFQNKISSDPNFRDSYTKAKYGRTAGFYDKSADNFYEGQGKTRNIFRDAESSGNAEIDDQNFKDTVNNHVAGSEASINSVHTGEGDEKAGKNGDDIEVGKVEGSTPEAKARSLVNGIAGKVQQGSQLACVGLRVANMAAVTVTAYQIVQSISYFLSLAEPLSKSIAGEGDASAINPTLNFFTNVTDSIVQFVDPDGKTRTETITGSPLQAEGAQLVLTKTPVNKSKVAPFSLNNIFGSALLAATTTGATMAACDSVMASSAVISLASNAVPGGTLAKFVVHAVAETAKNVALAGAVGLVIKTIIPYVAKIFTSNIFENYSGKAAGEFWTQGAAAANFRLATQASAFMPASEEYLKEQNRQSSAVLSQEAEADRLHRSPFDASSPNTFLGSLLSKFAFSATGSTLGNGLAGFGSLIRNSFKVFNPTASAADEEVIYTSSYQSCGKNKELDVVCDIYGNEIPARDYSTINLKPNNKKYQAVIQPNLDKNGKIIEGSELSKFISFCTERQSPWGVLDANIMNAIQTDFGVVGNNLYIVEDVVDIINAAEDVANRDWGTGANCVMSSSNPRWDNEFKYYQAYVEDMRIISGFNGEQNSTSTTNPVLAYIEEYNEKHPIDTSFEGTLARISGYTKDDISFLLEFTKYASEIANLDYSHLFVFGENQSKFVSKSENSDFNAPQILANLVYTPDLFVDRRNYTV